MTNCSAPRLTSRPQWLWKHVALSCVLVSILLPAVVPINDEYCIHHQDAPVPSEMSDSSIENDNGTEFRIVERDEWGARPPSDPLRKMKLPVPHVIICHTATAFCTTQSECANELRIIQNNQMKNDYADIAYNFMVGGDGLAYVGRNWNYVGGHSGEYNGKSIGIAFIGNFTSVVPPKTQLNAAQKLIELGRGAGKIAPDYKLLGHRQAVKTKSPGDALYNEIKKWPHWSSQPRP
ncbi:peptidoglycan-recognition protein SD-like [Temnothorax curvispinosus]|uniref:Peptidoglycan-recognition protein SD-like n=1 Tax=Temnothorax curvispinosus TaxID=300111 RepID=A0A6J1R735_9HYME|nr:peptidoglycan-recognition protein SD-like [Temnothorax curvispinosus]